MPNASLHFKEDKTEAAAAKNKAATHWAVENMKYCTSISGVFKEDPIEAAKEHFSATHYCADEGDTDYMDGEELLTLSPVGVSVYGLLKSGNEYFWTGEIKTVIFKTSATIE